MDANWESFLDGLKVDTIGLLKNERYWTTVFCPVPVNVVFKAISQTLRIKY